MVNDWYLQTQLREAHTTQRSSLRERYKTANKTVLAALATMEKNLEKPMSRLALAKRSQVSVRQLERLFSAHLQETVTERYLRIRLEKAAELLRKTGLSVTAISIACGFQSSSHFSRAFKSRHGEDPEFAAAYRLGVILARCYGLLGALSRHRNPLHGR